MAKKFLRNIVVTVYRMQPEVFFGDPAATNAIVIRNLHMKFKIEKSLTDQPNSCEVEILNLKESTRNEIKMKPALVRVEAGYGFASDGSPIVAKLFEGDLTFADSQHNGVEWVTKIQCGEGERAFNNARVNRSFKGGTDARTAIGEVAKSMGLKIPTNIKEAKALSHQFVSGVSLAGPSADQMTKLLKPRGMSWSVQNNQLQILADAGVRPDEAIVISAKTGMVGSPALAAPKKPGEPVSVKVKTLLEPALLPGGRIQITAEGTDGLFRIDKVTITGTNYGQEFYSEVDGSML
jgi:hypothetical protein